MESLEARLFFSAAPVPFTALLAEGKIISADLKAVRTADAAGIKSITADIRSAKLTKTDATALRTLDIVNAADLKSQSKGIAAINLAISTDSRQLFATETALSRKPTNTKLAARADLLIAKLSADASSALTLVTGADNKLTADDTADSSALGGVIEATNLIADGGFESPDVGNGTQGETDLGALGSGIYEYFTSGTEPSIPTQGSTIDGSWQLTSGSVEVLGNDPSILSPASGSGYFQWVPAEGLQSLDLDGVSPGTIQQSIPTMVGEQYTVSFELAGNPSQASIKTVQVSAGSASQQFTFDITGKSPTDMGWTNETMVFTATSASTLVQFASLDDSGSAAGPALDSISVVANPSAAQSKLTSAAGTFQAGLSAAVSKLAADASAALTTDVSNFLAVY
jgi:choice-of-anchor C domain-containing protein